MLIIHFVLGNGAITSLDIPYLWGLWFTTGLFLATVIFTITFFTFLIHSRNIPVKSVQFKNSITNDFKEFQLKIYERANGKS